MINDILRKQETDLEQELVESNNSLEEKNSIIVKLRLLYEVSKNQEEDIITKNNIISKNFY